MHAVKNHKLNPSRDEIHTTNSKQSNTTDPRFHLAFFYTARAQPFSVATCDVVKGLTAFLLVCPRRHPSFLATMFSFLGNELAMN